jgi:hypothetical protein
VKLFYAVNYIIFLNTETEYGVIPDNGIIIGGHPWTVELVGRPRLGVGLSTAKPRRTPALLAYRSATSTQPGTFTSRR